MALDQPDALEATAQQQPDPLTMVAILEQLSDHDGHPNSVCRHPDPARGPDQAYHTVTSALMDLTAGQLWISDGPPCGAGYLELGLGGAGG